jgi:hypothetical protein
VSQNAELPLKEVPRLIVILILGVVSADGGFGNAREAFATGITNGNSTANQTPNLAKLSLFPADVSSTGPRQGSSSTTSDPTLFRRWMLKTHSLVQSNPISSIFCDPVKESEAPKYTSIVKRPMDLRTLANKLWDSKVTSTEEYR